MSSHLTLHSRQCTTPHFFRILLCCKPFSTVVLSPQLTTPLSHPTYMIWGCNTSVGKTLVSTGLASSFLFSPPSNFMPANRKFIYIKPVQTGFPSDSDSRYIFNKSFSLASRLNFSFPIIASHSVSKSSLMAAQSFDVSNVYAIQGTLGLCDLNFYEERTVSGIGSPASELICQTLFAWKDAVSPHLAAERENCVVGDSLVVDMMEERFMCFSQNQCTNQRGNILSVVETAGGVASPGPSGTLQCDLYRPFRFPGVLVGDGRLGGISSTISAYESLKLRGYDIVAVIIEDRGFVNEAPLLSYLQNRVPVIVLQMLPRDLSHDLVEWFIASSEEFKTLKEIMLTAHFERIERLNDMPKKAREVLWWPFTQHKLVEEENVTVIDSRYGENFAVYEVQNDLITQKFDACASWWTQGPDASLQTELAGVMGYTAARFGHVMFPENVYEPALECAELLLGGAGKGWASKVYFSDNGSTAIEIALKMAFRKYLCYHGLLTSILSNENEEHFQLKVLALRGSYHGDTLGAMEAQAPSPFTGFLQQPWYSGRGVFLDPPTVFLHNHLWKLNLPEDIFSGDLANEHLTFNTRCEIFDKHRHESELARIYSSYLLKQLSRLIGVSRSSAIGALIIEPVIQAAGGMLMIDPLFQRVLVNECQNRNIPVIFDEVFTGFWRLGTETAAEQLGCFPDIACYAKLMTGGVVPLAATLVRNTIFESFIGDSKLYALLHGHSYTAHAMGCAAAAKSIRWFRDPQRNINLNFGEMSLRELWNEELVQEISALPSVRRLVTIGTVFSVHLEAERHDTGYASMCARLLLHELWEDGIYTRSLGSVVYLMCGPCTSPDICARLLLKLKARL